jgi:hypothetical protein
MTDAQAVGTEGPWAVAEGDGPEACAGRRFTFRKDRAARFPGTHGASLILSKGARPRFEPCIWTLLDDEENEVREMDVNYYEIQEVE